MINIYIYIFYFYNIFIIYIYIYILHHPINLHRQLDQVIIIILAFIQNFIHLYHSIHFIIVSSFNFPWSFIIFIIYCLIEVVGEEILINWDCWVRSWYCISFKQIIDMMQIMLVCSNQIKLDGLTFMLLVVVKVDHLLVIYILLAIDEIGRNILLDIMIPIFLKPLNN